jgi:hypothetical protein
LGISNFVILRIIRKSQRAFSRQNWVTAVFYRIEWTYIFIDIYLVTSLSLSTPSKRRAEFRLHGLLGGYGRLGN